MVCPPVFKLVGLGVLLTVCAVVYWPGLYGPFLFDDLLNLRLLGEGNGIASAADLLRFVMTGPAGPLGRPVSLFTFALNAQDWPADPYWFKVTNLSIHLVNGVLVYCLTRLLGRAAGAEIGRRHWLALAATALWLLHPIQITSVLYVVQRMNQLCALFVLAALVAYVHGRRLGLQAPTRGLVWMSLAIGVGGVLATFSKENGILLPLFVLILEACLLRPARGWPRPSYWRPWAALFLILPLALLVLRLLLTWRGLVSGYDRRDFSLAERLLTEPRVIFEYLGDVLWPVARTPTLFYDNYIISSGLLEPVTTIFALAGILLAAVAAWLLRGKTPVLSLAILWYLAGHTLESSVIALELVFEHRNYLPLVGPFFALAYYATSATPTLRGVSVGILLLVSAALAGLSWQYAHTWGDEGRLAQAWAREKPDSPRAQQFLGSYYLDRGDIEKTRAVAEAAEPRMPDHIGIELQRFQFICADKRVTPADLEELLQDAALGAYAGSVFDSLPPLMRASALGSCPPLERHFVIALLQTLANNPRYGGAQQQRKLYFHMATLYALFQDYEKAVDMADKAYAKQRNGNVAYNAALWMYQAGQPQRALEYIEKARAAAVPNSLAARWFFEQKKTQNAARIDALETQILKNK